MEDVNFPFPEILTQYCTVEEAADALHVTDADVYHLAESGRLRKLFLNRHYYVIEKKSLAEYLSKMNTGDPNDA